MKKILLCSMMVTFLIGYTNVAQADGKKCSTVNGRRVCAFINSGGSMESGKCKKDDGTYKKHHEACSPLNAPANSGWCIPSAEKGTMSCAAKECNDGWLLYTTNKRKEIQVVDAVITSLKNEMTTIKVGSQGLCREKSYLENLCSSGCGCNPDEKCVLNEVTVTNYNKSVQAFIGEELCVCVADNKENGGNNLPQKVDTNCTYKFSVTCGDGKTEIESKTIGYTKESLNAVKDRYGLTDEEIEQCKGGKDLSNESALYKKMYKKDLADFQKKLENKDYAKDVIELCKNFGGYSINATSGNNNGGYGISVDNSNAVAIENANRIMEQFYKDADSNRSVWRNSEGEFNKARLASDLTAGVVLGTVGGVVSGVIIKKKQLEKGFDALHCTVGGQTVADWGDEFNVGLR